MAVDEPWRLTFCAMIFSSLDVSVGSSDIECVFQLNGLKVFSFMMNSLLQGSHHKTVRAAF